MEKKDINEIVDEAFKGLEGQVSEKMKNDLEAQKATITKEIEAKGFVSKDEVENQVKAAKTELEGIISKLKKSALVGGNQKKSFKSILNDALVEGKDTLVALANKSRREGTIQLKAKEDEDLDFGNFESYPPSASGPRVTPRSNFFFRNYLPNVSTSLSTIKYLVEDGEDGGADIWTPGDTIEERPNKPGYSPKFAVETLNVDWIAGIVRIPVEMLQDIPWLRSYLTQMLLYGKNGLFVKENEIIGDSLDTNSTAYDGDRTTMIGQIYDAAFGQLLDNYHNPSVIFANNRDVTTQIHLHQAQGSGAYDVPAGTVGFVNGQLNIGGVPVVGTPSIPSGEFYAVDSMQTAFISRMNPEVRFFEEDRDNVPKNLITARAEERVGFAVYDSTAVIKGDFELEEEVSSTEGSEE